MVLAGPIRYPDMVLVFIGYRGTLQELPPEIIRSMRSCGVMTTCLPVRLDGGQWESAVFFGLAGPECRKDRQILKNSQQPLPVSLEADMIECRSAAVVMLRFEVSTRPADPLAGEVLLTPGQGEVQFQTLENLATQPYLRIFFADGHYRVIYSQQLRLGEQERAGYRSVLEDAVNHDAMIRLTGRYDPAAAIREVTRHYASHVSTG